MPYIIDRQQAFRDAELVAIMNVRRRGARSRLLLRDGSLANTLTRPVTLKSRCGSPWEGLEGIVWQKIREAPNA